MKYYFISDVHGQYDKMMSALEQAHFNKDADTIVSVGDPFDRGDKSLDVLKFLMSCPNRILIWGNHDLRLKELALGKSSYLYDYHNGVLQTLQSFCENYDLSHIEVAFDILENNRDTYMLLWQYFDECVFAAEWRELIVTHAWVPSSIYGYSADPFWREADASTWIDATWSHTENLFKNGAFPDKALLVGHWHSWRLRGDADDLSTFVFEDKLIAIDGCTNLPRGLVNVYVFETDEKPALYDGRK